MNTENLHAWKKIYSLITKRTADFLKEPKKLYVHVSMVDFFAKHTCLVEIWVFDESKVFSLRVLSG